MKYLRLYFKIVKYNINVQMQYKTNFLLSIPLHLAWTLKEVIVTLLLYNYTDNILGWNKYEFFFLLGTYFIADSVFSSILLPNINTLSNKIRDGSLDYVLMKPMDSQFMVLTNEFNVGLFSSFLLGIILIVISSCSLMIDFNLFILLGYILLTVNGIIIFSCIIFIFASFSFKTIKTDYIRSLFVTIANIGRKPIDIFPKFLQKLLFIFPVAFIAYVPSCFYLNKLGALSFLGLPISIIFIIISRKLWKFNLKHYTSAS